VNTTRFQKRNVDLRVNSITQFLILSLLVACTRSEKNVTTGSAMEPSGTFESEPEQIDTTYSKSNVCEVHHERMLRAAIPIQYGFYFYPMLFHQRERRLLSQSRITSSFPNMTWSVWGGCKIRPEKRVVVFRCQQCEAGLRALIGADVLSQLDTCVVLK
jgi:hypothetical protein